MFRVGQKVVCVLQPEPRTEVVPVKGEVYTVRETIMDDGEACIRLFEIVNAPRNYIGGFSECTFKAYGFRPVVERKTDISIFNRILDDVNRNAPLKFPVNTSHFGG